METLNYQVAAAALPEFFNALLIDRLEGKVIEKMGEYYIIEICYSPAQAHLIGKLKVAHSKDLAPQLAKHKLYHVCGALVCGFLEDGIRKLFNENNNFKNQHHD